MSDITQYINATMRDIENDKKDIHILDTEATYHDACDHIYDVLDKYGVSVHTVSSLHASVAVYDKIPMLLEIDIPVEGDPDSDLTVSALESLRGMADKFWEWVMKMCRQIRNSLSMLVDRIRNVFSESEQIVANQSKRLLTDRHLIDTNQFKDRTASLIDYGHHMVLLKSLPSMNSELYTVANTVMAIDWLAVVKAVAKAIGITIASVVFSAAVGGALKWSAIKRMGTASKALRVLKNTPIRSANNIQRITGGKLLFAGMGTWKKMGSRLTPNGALDMSGFLSDYRYHPKKNTIMNSGWDIQKATDVKELLAVVAIVKKMEEMNKALNNKTAELEKELKLLITESTDMHPKFVEAAKLGVKVKINMIASSQRTSSTLSKTALMLVKNMINVQRAIYACKR